MIEQGIYFALGCIVTALGAMMFAPIFWRRALRLTRQRLQLQIPLSMQEIFAERDQLRAEFAVERLRVEQELDRVQAGKARDMAELGRRSMEVTRLTERLSASRAAEQARETEVDRLSRELAERDSLITSLQAEALAAAETASRLRRDSSVSAREAADSRARSVELQASQAKITAEVGGLRTELQEAHELLERLQQDAIENALDSSRLRTLSADLLVAQGKADSLERQLADARAALAAAAEREKRWETTNGAASEQADAAAADIERLQAQKKALESELEAVRRVSSPGPHVNNGGAALPDADGGLRESIHALGLAVAAMTRESRRPLSDESADRDHAQPVA